MSEPMYVPSSEYADEVVPNRPGRAFGGVAIGILLFGVAGYTFPPGSVENATSFAYPVHYRPVGAASIANVVGTQANDAVLTELIEAARELEAQGCRAIIGACGYFANYQPQIRDAVDVPCFLSSLMQLPLILNSLPPRKKVAIICADGEVLPDSAALAHSGITDLSRLVIAGGRISDIPELNDEILVDSDGYNPKKLEREIVAVARQMVDDDPDIGAFLLECTLFPPTSYAVQRAVGLPVFDFVTMIDWVQSAVVKRPFTGYI
ncbi:hypothetical protein [Gordonia sp. (in: high G+C Gram-positive bacteria)]|uniref:hypothetical protein n=1 Tax=unclassified Gordonia (in: high G+C Gram-positive bacteria) TaxID=2657482 RepID=UPI0035270B13